MKKLVIFTVVMVLALAGAVFAANEVERSIPVAVATDDGPAAAANQGNTAQQALQDNLNNNKVNVATDSAQVAGRDTNPTNVDVDVRDALNGNKINSPTLEVRDSLNNNKVAVGATGRDSGQIAGRDTNPQYTDSNNTFNIVDNAILANVNVEQAAGDLTHPHQTITFTKNQHAEISGSFHDVNGVSNVNSAAGNLNTQSAATRISIGSIR